MGVQRVGVGKVATFGNQNKAKSSKKLYIDKNCS
jgi:hypothetical protein